jgi:hypothetical protein
MIRGHLQQAQRFGKLWWSHAVSSCTEAPSGNPPPD